MRSRDRRRALVRAGFGVIVLAAVAAAMAACGSFAESPAEGADASSDGPSSDSNDAGDVGVDAADDDASGDADAGIEACNGRLDCERVVFVTQREFNGDLGGTAGANLECQTAAAASMLPNVRARKFTAWISRTNQNAKQNIVHGTLPYRRLDGMQIAKNFAGLVDGTLDNAISRDENGQAVAGAVWTASTTAGEINGGSPMTCADWTDEAGGMARTGEAAQTDLRWTNNADRDCKLIARLYCFEY